MEPIAIFVASDVVLSLLPLTFIVRLNRPLRDKIVIVCLMGLGLFASATAIVKMALVKDYLISQDPLWDSVSLGLWGYVEQYVGILAACIPTLKAPFEKLLRKVGMLSTQDKSQGSKTKDRYRNTAEGERSENTMIGEKGYSNGIMKQDQLYVVEEGHGVPIHDEPEMGRVVDGRW
jgi:hypothetical protein